MTKNFHFDKTFQRKIRNSWKTWSFYSKLAFFGEMENYLQIDNFAITLKRDRKRGKNKNMKLTKNDQIKKTIIKEEKHFFCIFFQFSLCEFI